MKNKLHLLRNQQELTQKELASKAKISPRAYQYIESGEKSPSVYTAISLAALLDSTVEDIFTIV